MVVVGDEVPKQREDAVASGLLPNRLLSTKQGQLQYFTLAICIWERWRLASFKTVWVELLAAIADPSGITAKSLRGTGSRFPGAGLRVLENVGILVGIHRKCFSVIGAEKANNIGFSRQNSCATISFSLRQSGTAILPPNRLNL